MHSPLRPGREDGAGPGGLGRLGDGRREPDRHRVRYAAGARPDEWNRDIALNLTMTFNVTRCVVPGMVGRGNGGIVLGVARHGITASW